MLNKVHYPEIYDINPAVEFWRINPFLGIQRV